MWRKILCHLLLIFSLTLNLALANSSPQTIESDPAVLQCMTNFVKQYKTINGFKTTLIKKDWNISGKLVHDEKVELTFEKASNGKPAKTHFVYINKGSSGIRNNGMTVDYEGGNEVKIKFGKPDAVGFLFNGVASLVTGEKKKLTDPELLEDEIMTFNRAGFGMSALIFEKLITELSKPHTKGGVRVVGTGKDADPCHFKYTPHLDGYEWVTLKPTDSVFALEEKYGILAYAIYRANTDQFSEFRDLFVRAHTIKIKIPKSPSAFEAAINPNTFLPTLFRATEENGQVRCEYQFEDTEILK